MVCAPTGAGKTVIGEMALLYAYHTRNSKSIYTTPLKALSNQKYSDLIHIFGRYHTGLATGDISLNKEHARVTVMTTEVYRNLAWKGTQQQQQSSAVGDGSNISRNNQDQRTLDNTTCVVFDGT